MIGYLRYGAEVEDALVAQTAEVGDDVGDVAEGVGHQQVEAGQGRVQLLRLGQVLQTRGELAPCLATGKRYTQEYTW